jgi:3-phosphoshikimate 1-carboxyvinyltransferase
MAMGLALLGLRVPGVEVEDPDVVAKSYPGFWAALASLGGAHG